MGHKKCENGAPWKLFEKFVLYRQCTLFSRLKKFPWSSLKSTCFWVHKDLSYSYREGIDEKLKYKQKPYKMKGLKKVDKVLCLGYKDW